MADFLFIYIPLWFYSNLPERPGNFENIEIYIPLWFYSNLVILKPKISFAHLHSTMVLF